MKINKADVDKMIKEEFQKMIGKKKLTSKLSQINEELNRMDQEDANLEEVEAGGLKTTMSDTGLEGGGKQHAVNFTKKGSSLMEDEDEEETPMGEFEAKFAEIGKAIDTKMGVVDMDDEAGVDTIEVDDADNAGEVEIGDDDDFEEVEVSDDDNDTEEVEDEISEYAENPAPETHVVGGKVIGDEDGDGKPDTMNENKKNKSKVISEVKKPEAKNIFTEGLDARKKTALLEEMNRMKKFAGLSRDED